MKKIHSCVQALLLLVFGFAGQALCEPSYTLKQLCQVANKNAETIQIAKEQTYIAEQDKKRAQSVLIPSAALYGSYLNYKNDDIYTPDVNTLGGKLTQSFTLNGKELIAYDVSKKSIEKAKFSEQAIRSNYIFQVSQAYIQALNLKRLVEVADAEVERLNIYKNSVNEKLSVGSVTKTALFRAQAELSKAKTNQIVAINNVRTAKAGIVRLTGIEDQFSIAPGDIKEVENFSVTLEQIKSHALENRYEIMEAQKDVEIAQRTIAYEKGDYWPRIELEGGYREKDISMIRDPEPKRNMIPKRHTSRPSSYLPCLTVDYGVPRYARLWHDCARQRCPWPTKKRWLSLNQNSLFWNLTPQNLP